MMDTLLPKPRRLIHKKGRFLFDGTCNVTGKAVPREEFRFIIRQLSDRLSRILGFRFALGEGRDTGKLVQLEVADPQQVLENSPIELGDIDKKRFAAEGYRLKVSRDTILLRASCPRGLFYAAQTLAQLVSPDCSVECVDIMDWPDLAMRGIAVMLGPDLRWYPGSQTPTLERLKYVVRTMSEHKLNTISIEYADKVIFDEHPGLRHPDSFTKQEIRELVAFSEQHYVEVVPLLQCLGHLDYVLIHDDHGHLAEGGEEGRQICPLKPESFEFVKVMASELLELHPNSRYFHIGCDETRELGACPKCKLEAESIGKDGLYLNHVNKVCRWIKQQGKKPIIWDDMLCTYLDSLDRLEDDVVLMYWDYYTSNNRSAILQARTNDFGLVCDKSWQGRALPKLEETAIGDAAVRVDFEKDFPKEYLDRCRPFLGADYPEYINGFPYIGLYQEEGFTVIGAPCIFGPGAIVPYALGRGYINPSISQASANINSFCQKVARQSGEGIISTWWTSEAIPFELCWYSILITAEYAWHSRPYSRDDFDTRFAKQFYSTDELDIVNAMFLLEDNSIPYAQSYFNRPITIEEEIQRFERSDDLAERLTILRNSQTRAKEALDILKKRTASNSASIPLQHLYLAAKTIIHKINQIMVFHDMYTIVGSNEIPGDDLSDRLSKLLEELRTIRQLTESVFQRTMKPASVSEELVLRFSREERHIEKIMADVSLQGVRTAKQKAG